METFSNFFNKASMKYEEELGHANLNSERIYLYIMDLICNNWKHIYWEMKFLKNHFSKLFATITKGLGKSETSKNLPISKFSSPFNLKTLNTSNLLNLFHGQTFSKDKIISVLIFETKCLLIGLQNLLMHT